MESGVKKRSDDFRDVKKGLREENLRKGLPNVETVEGVRGVNHFREDGGSANDFDNQSEVVIPEWLGRFSIKSDLSVPDTKIYYRTKRVKDIILILLSTPLLLPLFAICIGLIKIESPGRKVFFNQIRTGQGGRRFAMYKFTTMVANSEELKLEYIHLNELAWPDFKISNDPRVTKVGKFLRKTSLDELPQLFNVLKGDMSLVGPRPTSFDSSTYTESQKIRLEVPQGLTGLWQIIGRGEMEFEDRVTLDSQYILRRSILLDLFIILKTFSVLSHGK